MELRQLRYFVAVVDCGSLSRAASMVHIVQSALSQQMAQLEDELGVQLLQRSVRGVVATDAGLAFYRHAQQVLRLISDSRDVVRAAGQDLAAGVRQLIT
jgi:LysR family nitrogen assimilation transcriptional regulator